MFALVTDKVKETINEHGMLKDCKTIIAGVSGGADSLCLFFIMKELIKGKNIRLVVAHVNHMLRGADADDDEMFVRKLCERYKIPCEVLKFDVGDYARKNSLGTEEAGRNVRYKFFNDLCEKYTSSKIAVAHNRNDRAETVFLNISRGAGINGLRGIPYTRDNIIRPLLDVTRDEIEECCKELGVEPRVDKTNYENVYKRNIVRNNIFPYINKEIDTDFSESLIRLSDNVSDDVQYLNKTASCIVQKIAFNDGGRIIFPIDELLNLDAALFNRIVAIAVNKLFDNDTKKANQSIERVHIGLVKDLIEKNDNVLYISLPGQVRVSKEYDKLIFYLDNEKDANGGLFSQPESYCYVVDLSNVQNFNYELTIDEIKCKVVVHRNNENIKEFSQKDFIQYFDCDMIFKVLNETKLPLVVRNRREGDFIRPYKGRGSCKLKKFFIDNKVSKMIRSSIPLLAIGNEIIWIPGYRTSETFKVNNYKNDAKNIMVSVNFDNNNLGGQIVDK